MRHLAPVILAALMITGCACNQRTEPEPAEPAPLLQDIPLLGEKLARAPKAEAPKPQEAASTDIPLLSDIPVIGHLFKSQPR